MRRFAILLIIAAALFAACTKPLPPQPENEPEETENAALPEEELCALVAGKTPLDDETYLYDDFDGDGNGELFVVTKNADGLRETWFCSSDGSVCECIRTSEHEWDIVLAVEAEQYDGIHAIISYQMSMGTAAHSDIFRLENGTPTAVAESMYAISCEENGSVILMRGDYDMMYDPQIGSTLGHTYKFTSLGYEDGAYYEYAAKKVPLDDIRAMPGSDWLFGQIEADENVPSGAYMRANGYGYVQCGDPEADRENGTAGYYCYYIFCVEDGEVAALVTGPFGSYDTPGIMADHFGDFPVRYE